MSQSQSSLEKQFVILLQTLGSDLPSHVPEFHFHPTRKWRLDFAWIDQKVAVELQGGTWMFGRHSRGKGYSGDCEKHNAAVLAGWRILSFTTDQVQNKPIDCIQQLRELLQRAK